MHRQLKTAFRSLLRNRTTTFINVFGLAIGLACAGLIFLWVEDEFSYDHVHLKKDRLYRVNVTMGFGGSLFTMESTPRPLAGALQKEVPGIKNVARYSYDDLEVLLVRGENKLYEKGHYTDSTLFRMLTFDFLEGSANGVFAPLYSIVLSESGARKLFGTSRGVVGQTITMRLETDQAFVVTGVVKDMPANSTLQFDWLARYDTESRGNSDLAWNSYGPYTFLELEPGTDPAVVDKTIARLIQRKDPREKSVCSLFAMKDWRLHNEFRNGKPTGGGAIAQVRLMIGIAAIILIIACFNFMNLSTANSQRRGKEIGVRKLLGSGKKRLVAEFMGEALLTAILATAVSLLLMLLALPAYNGIMQKNLSLSLLRPAHLFFLLIATMVAGLLAGSYPAHFLSALPPLRVLKAAKAGSGSAVWIRRSLVVLQFTVSVIFLIGTVVVYQQIRYMKNRDIGFDKKRLLEINVKHDIYSHFDALRTDLLHTGLISNAALADHSTLEGGNSDGRFTWAGKPPNNDLSIYYRDVSPDYVATSGMKMKSGRDFSGAAGTQTNNAIVSESLEKEMGKGSAVGKIITSSRTTDGKPENLTVIGVVKDFVFGAAAGTPGPVLLMCKPPQYEYFVYVRVRPGVRLDAALPGIAEVFKNDNPGYPLLSRFVDEQFDRSFDRESTVSRVAGSFAVLAILISCLGLFGLAAFTVERRTKEISIRKLLGASVTGLTALLSREFVQMVGIACLIAFPVAGWLMHDWLLQYDYRIPVGIWVFVVTGGVALLVCIATVSAQTLKTIRGNLVRQLRSE